MRFAVAAAIALTAVAGCSREETPSDVTATSGPAADAAVVADAGPPVAPRLKAGLWRVSMSGDGAAMTSRMCVDAAMQEKMNVIGAQQQAGACQQNTVSPLPGGGFGFQAVCDSTATGGGKATTTGQITGDMQTGYVNRMTTVTTGYPVAHMNRTTEMTAEGRYEGPCPADMKPGDMQVEGGPRFNMVDMAAGAARATPGR